jgi:hypothetical protein
MTPGSEVLGVGRAQDADTALRGEHQSPVVGLLAGIKPDEVEEHAAAMIVSVSARECSTSSPDKTKKEGLAVRRTVPPSAEIEEQIDRLLAVGVGENPRESLSN